MRIVNNASRMYHDKSSLINVKKRSFNSTDITKNNLPISQCKPA